MVKTEGFARLEKCYSYDDVLLKPKKTSVTSLSKIDTSVELAGIKLETPLMSAAMDTVTERKMAVKMAEHGGTGVVHRFIELKKQAEMFREIDPVAAAIGLNEFERANKLVESDVDILLADIAHRHHSEFIDFIEEVDNRFDVPICAGNVATEKGAKDLAETRADIAKVGTGPGSACKTWEITGRWGYHNHEPFISGGQMVV